MAEVARTLSASKKAWESGKAFTAAGFGVSDKAFAATVGLGEDHVLFSAQILRVVGRLNGIAPKAQAAGSDLRMLVGQLVGGSDQSPSLMAALRVIGRGVCFPVKPACQKCSLKKVCLTGKGIKR